MLSAFRASASGMVANQGMIDVIFNNLANINTPGFKQSKTEFQDLLYEKAPPVADMNPGDDSQLQDLVGSGVKIGGTPVSFAPGSVVQDGDPLHMAIQGEGFFVVRTADGGAAYTRDGSFTKDADGRLVNKSGDVLLPETRLPADARDVRVDQNGLVFARLGADDGSDVEVQVGEVQLARFTNPEGLVSAGGNSFLATDNSGPALVGYPGDEGYGTVQSGAIEGSNVDMGEQMTQMIVGQRAYAFNARALQTVDQMLDLANNLRR